MTKSEKLILEIQELLKDAADNLEDARDVQEGAVAEVLVGDFTGGVELAVLAAKAIKKAKNLEEKAAKLLVELIPQMKADGFANEIIYAVVETLIAEFLGA